MGEVVNHNTCIMDRIHHANTQPRDLPERHTIDDPLKRYAAPLRRDLQRLRGGHETLNKAIGLPGRVASNVSVDRCQLVKAVRRELDAELT